MKIKQQEPKFEPITITLETQEELDQIFAMAKYCSFSNLENRDSDVAYELFIGLGDKVVKVYSSESVAIFD